jgi:hypothetical protein
MSVNATIKVYLQALGGKFLGPHAYMPTSINVTLTYSGGVIPLPYLLTSASDDGEITDTFSASAIYFMPILTMHKNGEHPKVAFLSADINTIAANGQLHLTAPGEVATISVSIPRPSGEPLLLKQTVLLMLPQTAYRFTMLIPGLLLTEDISNNRTGAISVFVNMMCGCKISLSPPPVYWTPAEFNVSAIVTYNDGSTTSYPMMFDQQAGNSSFYAAIANAGAVKQVNYIAQQRSTGNYGYLQVTY